MAPAVTKAGRISPAPIAARYAPAVQRWLSRAVLASLAALAAVWQLRSGTTASGPGMQQLPGVWSDLVGFVAGRLGVLITLRGAAALGMFACVWLADARVFVKHEPAFSSRLALACVLSTSAVAASALGAGFSGVCLAGLFAVALKEWQDRHAFRWFWMLGCCLLDPYAGGVLALGGFVLTREYSAFIVGMMAIVAAQGPVRSADVLPWPAAGSVGASSLLLWWAARSPRLRTISIAAALISLGPTLAIGGDRVALPAMIPAWLGAGGAASAAIVCVAGLARLAAQAPRMAWWVVGFTLVEGVVFGTIGARVATRTPSLVSALSERSGKLLVLPLALCPLRRPDRAVLYRAWATVADRELYGSGECVHRDDPIWGEPSAVVALSVTTGDPLLVPSYPPGSVARALEVSEILVDRADFDPSALVALDPLLAHVLGPPQRDVAAQLDSYRISAAGTVTRPLPPYLRTGDRALNGYVLPAELLTRPTR